MSEKKDPNTLPLSEPVEFNGVTYDSLTLRKMKAKDMVAGDLVQGKTRQGMAILASMAGVPLGVVEEMSIDDFEKLGEVAAPLMGKSAMRAIKIAQARAVQAAVPDDQPSTQ